MQKIFSVEKQYSFDVLTFLGWLLLMYHIHMINRSNLYFMNLQMIFDYLKKIILTKCKTMIDWNVMQCLYFWTLCSSWESLSCILLHVWCVFCIIVYSLWSVLYLLFMLYLRTVVYSLYTNGTQTFWNNQDDIEDKIWK